MRVFDNSFTFSTSHLSEAPFGQVVSSTGTFADHNSIRFSTKYWDTEVHPAGHNSGLGYWGYRWSNGDRWISRDPLCEEAFLVSQQSRFFEPIRLTRFASGFSDAYDEQYKEYICEIIFNKKAAYRKSNNPYHFLYNSTGNDLDAFGLDNYWGSGGQNEVCCIVIVIGSAAKDPSEWWDPTEPAQAAQKRQFPGVTDPYDGAYRHCVAACLLSRKYGSIIGHGLRKAWDICHESSGLPDSPTDMMGEDWGEYLAHATKQTCEYACLDPYPYYLPGTNNPVHPIPPK